MPSNCQLTDAVLLGDRWHFCCTKCGREYTCRSPRLIVACQSDTPDECLPGCQFHKLLATLNLHPEGCQCASRAAQMDAWGPEGCRENMAEILGWLKEECEKRQLRYVESQARWLVNLAIKLAAESREPARLERARMRVMRVLNR